MDLATVIQALVAFQLNYDNPLYIQLPLKSLVEVPASAKCDSLTLCDLYGINCTCFQAEFMVLVLTHKET